MASGCGMDLVPEGLQGPSTAAIGEDISQHVTVSVKNAGNVTALGEDCTGIIWVYFRISADEVVDFDDTMINSIDFVDFPLAPQESKPVQLGGEYSTLIIPEYNTPLGSVYLAVTVDDHRYCQGETNWENNTSLVPIEILPAP